VGGLLRRGSEGGSDRAAAGTGSSASVVTMVAALAVRFDAIGRVEHLI
jgi:hypothetical protein